MSILRTIPYAALSASLLFAAGVCLAYVMLSKGLQVLIGAAGSGAVATLTVNSDGFGSIYASLSMTGRWKKTWRVDPARTRSSYNWKPEENP